MHDRRVISCIANVRKSGGVRVDAPVDYCPRKKLSNRNVRGAARIFGRSLPSAVERRRTSSLSALPRRKRQPRCQLPRGRLHRRNRPVLAMSPGPNSLWPRARAPARRCAARSWSASLQADLVTALASMIGAATIMTSPIFQGLAVSLLFGLASSTTLTVLVILAIYVVLRGDGPGYLERGDHRKAVTAPVCRRDSDRSIHMI